MGTPDFSGFGQLLLALIVGFALLCFGVGLAVGLSGCAMHPPTQAGYTAKRGMNNTAPRAKENRHF
jgi:hypothetical protein